MPQIIADTFIRANAVTLGANWTNVARSMDIVSNQCKADQASSGENLSYYSGAGWTGGNDQYSEALLNFIESGKDVATACRISGTTEGNANAYLFVINDADAAITLPSALFSVALYKQVAGSFTPLGASVTGVTIAVNDVIRIEAEGTTIRGLINGVQIVSRTDSALASGGPGLYVGSGFNSIWGNGTTGWAAGDFTVGPTKTPYQPAYAMAPIMAQ